MAEALVFVVLQKIATTIGKEVVTSNLFDQVTVLREIRYNIKQIEMELVLMQAFLRRVDVETSNNQTFELWSEQVKKVAREVEDVIDEYAYLVEKTKHTTSIVIKKLYYLKNASAWNEIATQLKEVKGNIDYLTQMRDRYGITIPHEASNNRNNANRLLNISDYSHLIDESGIVGNQKERSQLIQWLTKTSQDRAVISIWGMGGSGKTTLMTDIYKTEDVKRHFDCFAFVSVSQSFQVEDLLRSIIRQIFERDDNITTEFDLMNNKSLMETLYNELNKRYLIVLDDVWRRDAWIVLSRSFPKNSIGSRVVITTRNEDVAHLAIDNYSIKMRPLTDEEAWELFHKKAFAEQKEKNCPPEIMSWAMKIVNKCQGLPLAIVAIGSLLSFRRLEEKEWRMFYNQLSWELSSNSELGWVANVLNLSYDDLPTYLKNCFLYCSLLPEDSIIRMRWITRVLVAEGFVDDRGPDITMEEMAENYLMELVHRSLLEVVERTIYGRAKKFKMHDLVRDICIAKAKKESFGTICYNKLPTIDGKTRRIFICHPIGNIQPVADSSKLRSFILIQGQSLLHSIGSTLSNLKLLRVLCLNGSNIEILPDVIFELFNLHFLDLSRTKVKLIPKSLGKLKLLQSLDLSKTAVKKLPKEVCKLSNLRHLFVLSYHDYQEQQYDYFYGVTVPAMICSLKDLQTLCYIEANDEIVQSLGSLVMLRKLSLFNVKRRHIADLWASITEIPFLTHLGVVACDKSEVLNLQFLNPLPGLEKLYLEGKLEGGVIPSIFTEFSKLRDLRLGWLGLQEDPLKSFSHMSNLVELHLCAIYEGRTFTFCSGWFPKLQRLSLADMFELVSINIEDGAMVNLHLLELMGLSKLECVPEGMKHLCALKKLILADMLAQFIKNLEMIKTSFIILHSARKRDVIDAFFFSADVSLISSAVTGTHLLLLGAQDSDSATKRHSAAMQNTLTSNRCHAGLLLDLIRRSETVKGGRAMLQ